MNKELALEIASKIKEEDFEDFSYEVNGKIYGLKCVSDGEWEDEGKYQYSTDDGIIVEYDKDYNIINEFN